MNKVKHIVAIASGKGGVGKSTTAVNLALALKAMGASVGLLDADIYGPSQQLMLGIPSEQRPEQQGGEYLLPVEAHGLKKMALGKKESVSCTPRWDRLATGTSPAEPAQGCALFGVSQRGVHDSRSAT